MKEKKEFICKAKTFGGQWIESSEFEQPFETIDYLPTLSEFKTIYGNGFDYVAEIVFTNLENGKNVYYSIGMVDNFRTLEIEKTKKELIDWCWLNLEFDNNPTTWKDTFIIDILNKYNGTCRTKDGRTTTYNAIRSKFDF